MSKYKLKVFLIYCLTNRFNGKKYVGKFNRDIKKFKFYYGSGILIKRACDKHGKRNFTKHILETCKNQKDLNLREKFWIKTLNTTNIKNGYNLAIGGDGGDLSKFINYEALSKKLKLAITKYWKNISDVDRKKRSEKVSGVKNPMYGKEGFWKGKKMTEERVKQMSIDRKGKFLKEDNPNWRGGSTFCECGNRISSVNECCHKCRDRNGVKNPFYGKSHSEETIKHLSEKRKGVYVGNQEKQVVVDKKKYRSLSQAARELKINASTILFRIRSKHFSNYNYITD